MKGGKMKKLAIIINAHDASQFLGKCLRTILLQKLDAGNTMEIIISYDTDETEDIEKVINNVSANGKIKTAVVPSTGRDQNFKTFFSFGYDAISDDTNYLFFIPASSYINGTDFINTILNHFNEKEDSIILKNYNFPNLMVTSNRGPVVSEEWFLSSIIFERNQFNLDMLGEFFSHKVRNLMELNIIVSLYDKAIKAISPLILDLRKENSIIFVKNNNSWLRQLIKYYLSLYNLDKDIFKDKVDVLDTIEKDERLSNIFKDYMENKLRKNDMNEKIADNNIDIGDICDKFIIFEVEDNL